MQAHSGRHHRWRRFNHKYGVYIFVAIVVVGVMGLVALITYMLTSMNWRPRY